METIEYKGYKISEIYQSCDRKMRMSYAISSGPLFPHGWVCQSSTVAKVKAFIDSKISENTNN